MIESNLKAMATECNQTRTLDESNNVEKSENCSRVKKTGKMIKNELHDVHNAYYNEVMSKITSSE